MSNLTQTLRDAMKVVFRVPGFDRVLEKVLSAKPLVERMYLIKHPSWILVYLVECLMSPPSWPLKRPRVREFSSNRK